MNERWGEIMNELFFWIFGKCGVYGGMILTGETEGLGEKPAPVPLCPPQIPLD
jgi:hypothetical protein